MNVNPKDFFEGKAEDYDREVARRKNVSNIAQLMMKEADYKQSMSIMDFGSGTGLLLSDIAPSVGKITAIDISKSMNEVLESKRDLIKCELEIMEMDLTKENLERQFDGIISSMTIHHVKDISALFKKFHNMLAENGIIAIADLDSENGSFHKENTGVHHLGFDRAEFLEIAKHVGFKNLKIQSASIIEKPYGKYPVFLLTGNK
ncbi:MULTISPECIES: class I SAM-dependent methyltransferase [unclassified Lentimicrobium]|uniref:class I SAM-dependent DNA methyltransferase n=1 Tax=unclassified Lentimicrobium TaxID=2677434 RepID=UPI0015538A01|nr:MULTISPECIES: class I SAM-dependent methyltransferase [unclassified Lentimicrobium]NPD47095.1 class I SAM-dependent methyltransferase [Lentimicrobium sp. S6]NPD85743.1 class I SAM-dependent methyltransferase [Lentimicrobium sp. L6]